MRPARKVGLFDNSGYMGLSSIKYYKTSRFSGNQLTRDITEYRH